MKPIFIHARNKRNRISTDFTFKGILLLCGFVVFSPISSILTLVLLKLPFALPELLFIPFYFYLRNKINLKVDIKSLLIGLLIIIILLIVSLIVNNFRPTSILSTARGYFYLILSFTIFKNKKIRNFSFIMYLALGSVLAWLFLSITLFTALINKVEVERPIAVYGNMIALCLAISIPILFKNIKYIYITFILAIVLSLTSGVRRQVIIFIVSYVMSLILSIKLSVKSIFRTSALLILSSIFLITIYPFAKNYLYDISPELQQRVFLKSEQLIQGDLSASDITRVNYINQFLSSINEYIFPRGFVSKRTIEDKGTGIYMDSPFIELFYTFGIFICLYLVFNFIRSILFHANNYYRYKVTESGVCLISAFVIIVLIMVEGSFLNYAYTTPFTGFIIARISSRYNLVKT